MNSLLIASLWYFSKVYQFISPLITTDRMRNFIRLIRPTKEVCHIRTVSAKLRVAAGIKITLINSIHLRNIFMTGRQVLLDKLNSLFAQFFSIFSAIKTIIRKLSELQLFYEFSKFYENNFFCNSELYINLPLCHVRSHNVIWARSVQPF